MIPRHHLGLQTITTYVLNVVVLVCGFFFTAILTASAATYTWDGGGATNDWSECANWTSNTCPGSGDIAQFDGTSVKNATVDASFGGTVSGIAVNAGYTGTITQARNITIGSSNFTMASGTWSAGTTTFDINDGSFTLTGGSFLAAGGTSTVMYNFTWSGGTITASSTRVFQFDDSSINQSSTLTCTGTLGVTIAVLKDSDGSDFTLGSGCTATSTLMTTTGGPDNTQIINGTLNLSGAGMLNQGSLTVGAAGVINANGLTASFIDTSINQHTTISCTGNLGVTISVLKDSDGSDFTLGSGCTATSTLLTTTGGPSNDQFINGTLNLTATGTLNQGSLSVGATGTINSNGYKAHFFDTSVNQSSSVSCTGTLGILIEVIKDSDGSDFTLGSGCRATTTDNFQVNGGNSSDLTVNGSLTLNHAATTTVGASVSVGSSGEFILNTDLAVRFNLSVATGGMVAGTRTIQFYDTSTSQTSILTCTGSINVPIRLNKDSNGGDFTIAAGCAATTTGTVIMTGGTATDVVVNGTLVISQTATTTVTGAVTIGSSGVLTVSANVQVNAGFTLTTGGLFNHNGYFVQFYDTSTSHPGVLTCSGAFPTVISINKAFNGSDFTIAAGCAATTTGPIVIVGGNATDLFVNGTLGILSDVDIIGSVSVGASGTINANGYKIRFFDTSTTQPSTLTCTGALNVPIQIDKNDNGSDFTVSTGCAATTTGTTTLSAGSNGSDLFVNGTLYISQTATTTVGGNVSIASGGYLAVNGDVSLSGSFSQPAGASFVVSNGGRVNFFDTSVLQAVSLTCSSAFAAPILINRNDNASTFTLSSGCTATATQVMVTGNVNNNMTIDGTLVFAQTASSTVYGTVSVTASGSLTIYADLKTMGGFNLATTGAFVALNNAQVEFFENTVLVNGTLSCVGSFPTFIQINKLNNASIFTLNPGCTATATKIINTGNTNNHINIDGALQAAAPATVGGTVTVGSTGRFALNGFGVSANNFVVNGTLARIGNETIMAPTLGDNSIIEFTGTSTYTTLGTIVDFESISFTGGGIYTVGGAYSVEDNFTSTNGSNFVMSTSGSITFDGGNQTITGTSTFNNFTKVVTATSTLTFGAGQEQTLNGVTALTGTLVAPLLVRSAASGTQYFLDFSGPYSFEYVSLQDAHNTNGGTVICYPGCTDVANNTNFTFVGDALTGLRRWDGGGANTLWSNPLNWEFDQVPSVEETVVFATTSLKNSTIDAAFGNTIGGIVIVPGYTGTISASTSLTITTAGLSIADGTFVAPSSTLNIIGGFTQLPSGNFSSMGTTNFLGGGTTTLVLNGALFGDVTVGGLLFSEEASLTAYWKLDEGTGSAISDSSGNGETATLQNMESGDWSSAVPTIGYLSENPYALNFDGSDEYALANIDLGTSWTVSSWFKWPLPTTGGGYNTLTRASENGEHQIIVQTSNNLLGSWNGSSFRSSGFDMDSLAAGWHHLAARGSGSATEFFINGVNVGSSDTKSTSNIYAVGNFQGGNQQWGWIDDFRVYGSTAISDDEIERLASTIPNGAIVLASSSLLVGDDLIVSSVLDMGTSACDGGSCSLSVGGDFTNSGTFLARTGTTTFSGVAAQTATGTLSATSSFHNLEITNNAGPVTFGAPLAVTGTFTMGPDTAATFLANATHTVERLDWDGESTGSRITLRSTEPDTQWILLPNSIATTSYIDAQDAFNASTSNIQCVDGCADSGNNTNWDFPLSAGFLVLSNHPEGQAENQFTFQNKDDIPLFGFTLAPDTEGGVVDDVVLSLRGVRNLTASNLTDLRLYRDVNSDGLLDGGDTQVLGTGIFAIDGETGTITFSTGTTSVATTTTFIVTGDTVAIKNGMMATFDLTSANITAVGASTSLPMLTAGTVSAVQHIRTGNAVDGGAGSSGQIGGDAPAGVVRGGGQSGGGVGDLEAGQVADGENIAPDPDFFRPTTNGSPHNEWTSGANAYASDGVYATAASANLRQTYGGFGLNIPGSNTIQGIQVKLDGSGTTAAGTIQVGLSFDGGSSVTTLEATPTLSGSDVVYTLGGQTNLWGRAWTATELNDTNFRLRVVAQPSSNTVRLDAIEVRVYHTAGGGGAGGGEQEL